MVPLVLLVHPDPPWSTFLVKFQKVWIRMDRSGPGGPRGPQPLLVDQERSEPPWTTLRHFPDAPLVFRKKAIRLNYCLTSCRHAFYKLFKLLLSNTVTCPLDYYP